MSRVTDEEDRLFDAWASHCKTFARDGIVDVDEHEHAPVKLLFILKEVNDPGDRDWDLRQFLRDGACAPTWNTVTRWVEGIQSLPRFIRWRDLSREIDDDRRKRALRKIIAINLKKEHGRGTAVPDEVRVAARRDREFISGQLSLYEPDYVICCGGLVGDLLVGAENIGVYPLKDDWKLTERGVWYRVVSRKDGKSIPVISYHHPQQFGMPRNLLHYGLMDAVVEL